MNRGRANQSGQGFIRSQQCCGCSLSRGTIDPERACCRGKGRIYY